MNNSSVSKEPNPAAKAGVWWLTCAFAVGLSISACNEETTSADSRPSRGATPPPTVAPQDPAPADQNSLDSGEGKNTAGSVKVSGTQISITLPRDQSAFPPGPDMPFGGDPTVCLGCHDPGDVAEFQADRSPNFELVKKECTECHSADYSLYQPPQTKAGWANVVKKMADKFDTTLVDGVPTVDVMLNPDHQALMTDYLTAINGR